MTTPQPQPAPSQHHPAVKSETMTERKRCLAWIDRFTDQIQDCAEEVRDSGKRQDLLDVFESLVVDLRDFRTRIESGEQA